MIAVGLMLAAATPEAPIARCASAICTVAEVKPNVVEWDGRELRVSGWLSGCHRTQVCQLKPNPDAPYEQTLTIDFVERIEPALGRLDGKRVVLLARVTDECSGENICVDRAPELIPLSVERAR